MENVNERGIVLREPLLDLQLLLFILITLQLLNPKLLRLTLKEKKYLNLMKRYLN